MPPLVGAALIVLFEGFSIASLFPVTHAYCEQFGGGAVWVGVLFALVPGPKVVMNPVWGRLSDRFGRRRILAVITLGTMSASIGWAVTPNLVWLAPGIVWLAASRLLAGIFSAQAAVAQAVAADVTTTERRAGSMAILGAAFALAITTGPLIGGLIGKHISYAAVGWLGAGMQALSLLVILFLLPETRRSQVRPPTKSGDSTRAGGETGSAAGKTTRHFLRGTHVLRLLLVTLVMTLGFAALTSTYGLLTQQIYGFDTAHTGYAFAFLGLLAAFVQGGAVRGLVAHFGERSISIAGLLLLVVGFGLIAFQPTLWLFIAATGLIAIGAGLVVPCLTAMLSQRVGDADQGSMLGFNQSATGLGRAAGFVLGGILFAAYGASAPYATAAALIVAALVLLLPVRGPRQASPA